MKKLNVCTFLLSLAVISFSSSCSSTKYGAHFQASKYQPRPVEKQEISAEKAPVKQEVPEQVAVVVAEPALAEAMETNASSPVSSVKEVYIETEVPKEEDLTKRREEVVREVKERMENMSRKEKKELKRQVRKIKLSEYVKSLPSGELVVTDLQQESRVNIAALILAIVLPPLGVYVHQGEINNKFWLSLVLTILGYVPGQIYAVLLVLGVFD